MKEESKTVQFVRRHPYVTIATVAFAGVLIGRTVQSNAVRKAAVKAAKQTFSLSIPREELEGLLSGEIIGLEYPSPTGKAQLVKAIVVGMAQD